MTSANQRAFIRVCVLLGVAACLAMAPNVAFGQGSRKDDIVLSASGHPIAGATIRVCQAGATGNPCNPLATIYSDATLTATASNPFQGDGIGNYHFYAPAGRYMVQITGTGITGARTYPDVILAPDVSSSGAGNDISAFGLTLGGEPDGRRQRNDRRHTDHRQLQSGNVHTLFAQRFWKRNCRGAPAARGRDRVRRKGRRLDGRHNGDSGSHQRRVRVWASAETAAVFSPRQVHRFAAAGRTE
jgi:hypothetical protein